MSGRVKSRMYSNEFFVLRLGKLKFRVIVHSHADVCVVRPASVNVETIQVGEAFELNNIGVRLFFRNSRVLQLLRPEPVHYRRCRRGTSPITISRRTFLIILARFRLERSNGMILSGWGFSDPYRIVFMPLIFRQFGKIEAASLMLAQY